MRIAIAQINTIIGDIVYNRDTIIDYIGKPRKDATLCAF